MDLVDLFLLVLFKVIIFVANEYALFYYYLPDFPLALSWGQLLGLYFPLFFFVRYDDLQFS